MVLLSIGYTSGKCDIYDRLKELSTYFKEKGISIELVESDSGEMHFVKCIVKDEENSNPNIQEVRKSFNIYAANILYQVIVDSFEIDVINKIIKDNYHYFKGEEAHLIAGKCIDILTGTNVVSNEDYLCYVNRKNNIVGRILEFINECSDIVVEGFLRFRLKEFNNELVDMIERVVEEYLVEREYNEFIKLLKYFVDIQESRIEIINIVIGAEGNYFMYDGVGNEITEELLRDLLSESFGGEANYDDLLVSSLITAAPRYIAIHNLSNVRNKEIIETIKNVFCERVSICTGCDLCIKQNPAHKI